MKRGTIMVERDKISEALAAFEAHLDIHGARAERWSAADRQRFETLLANEPRAQTLMAEERAFERLLDRMPSVDAKKLANLGDRIAAAVDAEKRPRSEAAVVELSKVREARRTPSPRYGAGWRVASALAASLILGVYIGTAPGVVSAVEAIADTVGITEPADDDNLAFFDDNGSGLSEDLL